MPEPITAFSLVDEQWIKAQRLDGSITELSLMETFEQANELRQVLGELPTQVFAINRLLLAILYRSTPTALTETDWTRFWNEQRLPVEDIANYLRAYADRFDLLHPTTPFYQVADLHTPRGEFSELTKLIGDAPVGAPFLTTRLGAGLESLTFAEAARWLVHCQAFDVSGIKSGAVGDPRAKGGRGYPIGMGSAGYLGGVLVEGETQLQTLLLNLIPSNGLTSYQHNENDLPVWERSPQTAAQEHPGDEAHRPLGPVDVLTWQSRRIRLINDGQRVRQVLISNGDKFSPVNLENIEAMTAWRRSPTQEKKLGLTQAFMPRTHTPGRSIWRGLEPLLIQTELSRPPATHEWIATLVSQGILPPDFVTRTRAIGVDYINQSSIIGEIVDDEVSIPVRVLHRERAELRTTVAHAVTAADNAASAFSNLAGNLDKSAGGDGTAARDNGRQIAYSTLDRPFRHWLFQLRTPNASPVEALDAWNSVARGLLLDLGEQAVAEAGPSAWTGRPVDGRHLDAARAEMWFRQNLYKSLPFTPQTRESA